MRRYITLFNIMTSKLFGSIGRPVATGVGLGVVLYAGVPAVTGWIRGEPVVLDGRIVIGVAMVTVALTEATLYLVSDQRVVTEVAVKNLKAWAAELSKDPGAFDAFVAESGLDRAMARHFVNAAAAPVEVTADEPLRAAG